MATYNISWNDLASKDLLLNSIANNGSLHSDISLKGGNNISSLLLLIPSDDGVKKKNGDNNTEINPGTQTSGKQDSDFHN